MSKNKAEPQKSQDGPDDARKKPDVVKNKVSGAREERLADALRANLRRRKQGTAPIERKDD